MALGDEHPTVGAAGAAERVVRAPGLRWSPPYREWRTSGDAFAMRPRRC
jgi:hypothetical protein